MVKTTSILAISMASLLMTGCLTTKTPTLELLDRHSSGLFDEGASEIVAFHANSGRAFVTNANDNSIDIINLNPLTGEAADSPITTSSLVSTSITLPESTIVSDGSTISLGGPNSAAIHVNLLAVAIEADTKQDNGVVAFYQLDNQGNHAFIKAVKVGALPDMVTFTYDGRYLLVANEGEPSGDYRVDPEGSISLIAINDGLAADESTTLTFDAFNAVNSPNVLVGNNPSPETTSFAQDLEPEYITVANDSKSAFVSLQENNAIAVINLDGTPSISTLFSLGFKDHGLEKNSLDADKDDEKATLLTQAGLLGRYQPDTIASYEVKGTTYIVTANEGDAREYIDKKLTEENCSASAQNDTRSRVSYVWDDACIVYKDEWKIKDLNDDEAPHASATFTDVTRILLNDIEDLVVSADLGLNADATQYESLYAFGGRSFSIYNEAGQQVFDSGNDFERITAERFPDTFNSSDNKTSIDNRSDNKGPEPEALALGKIGNRTYAFIGLERMGGIMIYDITVPEEATFVEYINHRNYDADPKSIEAGDLAPEGMAFVSAKNSPTKKPLLLVANEVSGTLTVYQVAFKTDK
jgi:DNA-binding beta-propeller fold protein YncE